MWKLSLKWFLKYSKGKQHLKKQLPFPNLSGKEAVQVFSGAVM